MTSTRTRRALVALAVAATATGGGFALAPVAGAQQAPAAGPAATAPAGYLALEGVPGDATTPGFVGQIVLTAASFGASNPVSLGPGGPSSGRVSVSSFNLQKPVDSATVPLFEKVLRGTSTPRAVVTLCGDSRCTPSLRQVFTMTGVFVDSTQQGASGGAPTESVSLAFETLQLARGDQQVSYDARTGGS